MSSGGGLGSSGLGSSGLGKWMLVGLCGVGALGLAYTAGAAWQPAPHARAESGANQEESGTSRPLATQDDSLDTRRLRRLERTVAELSGRLGEQAGDSQDDGQLAAPPEDAATLEQQARLAEMGREVMVSIAKERMAKEPRDAEWASTFENAVLDSTAQSFPNLTVDSAECRSTLCEVRVGAKTAEEIDKFLLEFPPVYPDVDRVHYELIELADGSHGVEMHMLRRETAQDFVRDVESTLESTIQNANN